MKSGPLIAERMSQVVDYNICTGTGMKSVLLLSKWSVRNLALQHVFGVTGGIRKYQGLPLMFLK